MTKRFYKNCVLVLLFILTCGLHLFNVNQYSLSKINDLFNYTQMYSPLNIPNKAILTEDNYISCLSTLEKISKETEISFMKKTTNESYSIRNSNNFIFLPRTEIIMYYQNIEKESVYNPPLSNTVFRITDIQNSIIEKDFEGNFFLLTKNEDTYNDFLGKFVPLFNKQFNVNYSVDDFWDFNDDEPFFLNLDRDVFNIRSYLIVGGIFFFVALFFLLLSFKSDICLLRNNGFSVYAVFSKLLGIQSCLLILSFLVLLIIYTWLNYGNVAILLLVQSIVLYFLVYMFSCFIILYSSKKIKRKFLGTNSFLLPFMTKILFLIILAIFSTDLSTIFISSTHLFNHYLEPSEIRNDSYFVFYPLTVGKNQVEFNYDGDLSKDADDALYEAVNKYGSILVNVDGYSIEENEVFARDIKVNPNYLNKFSLVDEFGNRVSVEESEAQRILLIPEKYKKKSNYRNELESIKEYYWNSETQDKNDGNKIIFLKDDQPIFTFNPQNPWVTDYPIVNVLTLNNSDYWGRNAINGDLYPPLKIKVDQLPDNYIEDILENNQLLDNLPSFIKYDEAEVTFIKRLSGSLIHLLLVTQLTVSSFSIVSFLTTNFYFMMKKRKFYLLRLNGFSFRDTYKEYLLLLIAQSFIAILVSTLLFQSSITFIINIAFAWIIDLIISSFALLYLEKNNQSTRTLGG